MPVFRYDRLPVSCPNQHTQRRLAYTEHLMMVVVDFSGGPRPPDPPHRHPHEQVSYVAQGPINVIIGEGAGQEIARLESGDMFIAPPNVPHTVEVLGETARLIDCFYPIREDFL